jgi:hypothetical protein
VRNEERRIGRIYWGRRCRDEREDYFAGGGDVASEDSTWRFIVTIRSMIMPKGK